MLTPKDKDATVNRPLVTPLSRRCHRKKSEVRSQSKDKKTSAPKPAAPPDSRFQPFFSHAYESYRAKHGRAPIWTGKDRQGLKTLLNGAPAAALPLELLTGLWDSFVASTEPFTAKQGDSLAYFCSNLDKFSDGPIVAEKGMSNGKPSIGDNAAITLASHVKQGRIN